MVSDARSCIHRQHLNRPRMSGATPLVDDVPEYVYFYSNKLLTIFSISYMYCI